SRRRHTRFSRDWSSDVCSSDLPGSSRFPRHRFLACSDGGNDRSTTAIVYSSTTKRTPGTGRPKLEAAFSHPASPFPDTANLPTRSEERRVGKECRSRASLYDYM